MKMQLTRRGIQITPENDQDRAFIEDTMGYTLSWPYLEVKRMNIAATDQLACIELVRKTTLETDEND